jgi:hypothetical protein
MKQTTAFVNDPDVIDPKQLMLSHWFWLLWFGIVLVVGGVGMSISPSLGINYSFMGFAAGGLFIGYRQKIRKEVSK